MEHLDTFLARHPPFNDLGAEVLAELAAEAQIREFEPGEPVLVEDGPPAAGLWVLVSGALDLLHEGETVQVIAPGECFGHPSLLTGLSPAFTVRAREPSACALMSRSSGHRVFGTLAGATYLAQTMRKRLTRTGHTVHALLDVGTTPVSAIMRPPRFCDAGASVREAAQRLREEPSGALLVKLGDGGLGVLTDQQVRDAVADGRGLEAPVRDLARVPLATIPAQQLAVEATVEMVAAGSEHLAVLDHGRVAGVVSAGDLLGLEARSPIALRHLILEASDERELERATAQLAKLFLLLVRAGVPPRELGRVLSLQHDAVVARLVDFSIRRHGEAPLAWAWLDLGSAARREFTLASDQDNALAYATPRAGEEPPVDAYFERLGTEVNDGLARCGIGIDNNGVLAGQRLWRMSKADWLSTFRECLREPDESHLVRATVAFDFRAAAGGLSVAPELTQQIRAAREHPAFMRLIARSAAGFPVALNFRGQLAVERDGAGAGRVDIKRGGIIPVVNLVRFHALASGVTISPTLDRIEAVRSVGGLAAAEADSLREAFEVISRVRFEHHAAAIAAGQAPDNLLDPDALTPIARTELREALAVVRRAQRRIPG